MTHLAHNIVGRRVGARRWPHSASHPDAWARPHQGSVLAQDDPRAWAGTLAFAEADPDPAAVTRHVERCRAQGLLQTEMPVLWDFPQGQRVLWEKISGLRSAEEDLAAWQAERELAYRASRQTAA